MFPSPTNPTTDPGETPAPATAPGPVTAPGSAAAAGRSSAIAIRPALTVGLALRRVLLVGYRPEPGRGAQGRRQVQDEGLRPAAVPVRHPGLGPHRVAGGDRLRLPALG